MMRVGITLNAQVEMLFFTISYQFLQLLGRWRILGIIQKIGGADHYPPLHPILKVLDDQDRHQVPAGESR
jgi:hypothetical protein